LSYAFGGREARFCYVSAGQDESYQISVEPPEGGHVVVNLWSVETRNDEEFHRQWKVPVCDLEPALEEALAQIRSWGERDRG